VKAVRAKRDKKGRWEADEKRGVWYHIVRAEQDGFGEIILSSRAAGEVYLNLPPGEAMLLLKEAR
jgi:hypothetical protein